MSSDSQELLSQPLRLFGSGGGSSGGESSNGGGGSFAGGAFSEVPVNIDPGPFLDINTLLANAVSPLLLEIRKLQKENKQQSNKLEMIQNQVAVTQLMVKEMKESLDKEKKPLKTLLKIEGVEEFKKRVWQCMHLSSGMEEEEGVWTELVRKLRENEWIVSDSARDLDNLLKCFHEERGILRQQVPDRINKDMCNKSIESSVALTKTFSYLNTRGLGRLRGADLLMLYQLAYIKCQYLNEKVPAVDSCSKAIRSRAEKGLWEVVYKKTQKSTCNVDEMKAKITEAIKNGYKPHK